MRHFSQRVAARYFLIVASTLACLGFLSATAAEKDVTDNRAAEKNAADSAAEEHRLFDAIKYLASDELEGRGLGSKGLDQAADFIAGQFAQLGLKNGPGLDGPFQKFPININADLGPAEKNHLAFVLSPGPQGAEGRKIELQLNDDFTPLAIGGSGSIDLPIVFAGYGITAKKEKYDDFDGIDVKGKAVIILRHEPQQNDPHSVFNGTKDSIYAPISRKVSNAYEHGAAAVILCTDQIEIQRDLTAARKAWQDEVDRLIKVDAEFAHLATPTVEQLEEYRKQVIAISEALQSSSDKLRHTYDPVLSFDRGGAGNERRNFPVLHCRRGVLDQILQASLQTDLATLEKRIDKEPSPRSRELTGWRVVGEANVVQRDAEVKNIIGVLEGEGPHTEETIVIGAHYDHLGHGGQGSLAPGSTEIHNGADDNASGSVALLEIARQLVGREKKLPRRIVFIAFTGEERGLLGSARYCREPVIPLDKTIAMLNLDMVGRLRDEKVIIYGTETAAEFDSLVDRECEKYAFQVKKEPSGFGPSDHSSFYAKKIPVLHFFTGSHADYHRPTDDYDKINVPGMRRVADMVVDFAVNIAEADTPPQYKETKRSTATDRDKGGDRPYFGSIPDFGQDKPGYVLSGVSQGGPAQRAGMQAGDVIVTLGDSQVGNLEDFDSALRKYKAGDRVPVVVHRGDAELKLEVLLEPPK